MKTEICFLLIWLCFSCKEEGIPAKHSIDYASLKNTVINEVKYISPHFDSICIYTGEGDALSSMVGFFFLQNDTIGFADQQLASILFYDSTGHFLTSRLKRGRGPNEILGLDRFALFPNRQIAVLDGNWYLSIFSPEWKKMKQSEICWYSDKTTKQIKALKKIKDVNTPAVYEFDYEGVNIKPWKNNYLIFPINIELTKCNAYLLQGADYYYENAYTLGIIDADNGQIQQMICPRSIVYQQHKYIPNFRNVIFDVYKDTLFFSFQADSLIYKMNLPQSKKIEAYGLAGKNMQTNYRTTITYEDASENYGKDILKYGYYTFLKYIPETNFLFRGYSKGENRLTEGVQVYCNNYLLFDFDVPSKFEIFGYKAPYYYAKIAPNNESEEMVIYKFKL